MNQSYYLKFADVEKKHWWFSGRRAIISSLLRRLDLPKKSLILDAGCGTGGSFEMLASLGEVYGMDVNDTALSFAKEKGYVSLGQCNLPEKIPFGITKFHLIVLLDVLEHLEKDRESLKALINRMNPGGWFVVTVPAYQWMWSAHDVFNHHHRRYTRKSLLTLFRDLNVDVIRSTYFNSLLFPVAMGVRFIRTATRRDDPVRDLEIPSQLLNSIMFNIFRSERYLIHSTGFPFGLSCLVLARRKA